MKKSELKKLVLEALKGYSKYAPGGVTQGGTTDDFRNILTAIAKTVPDEDDSEEEVEVINEEGNLSASEIAEFVKEKLKLQDYDVDVRLFPNHKEVKLTIKRDPSVEDFNTIIKYLEDNGYTVDQMQSRREGESDDDRYYYPRIVFK